MHINRVPENFQYSSLSDKFHSKFVMHPFGCIFFLPLARSCFASNIFPHRHRSRQASLCAYFKINSKKRLFFRVWVWPNDGMGNGALNKHNGRLIFIHSHTHKKKKNTANWDSISVNHSRCYSMTRATKN